MKKQNTEIHYTINLIENKEVIMDITAQKNEFLYKSISDIQSTIRAVDSKISFLLVILLVFTTKLNAVFTVLRFFWNFNNSSFHILFIIISIFFLASWSLAILLALRTLIAINSPESKITGNKCKSVFYPASLFLIRWRYVFFCCESKSDRSLKEYLGDLPKKVDEITQQLALEQIKLTYIVQYKIKQSKVAFYMTLVWLFLGGLLYTFYNFLN